MYLLIGVVRQGAGQLAREGALADAALAGQHENLVPHVRQPLRNLGHVCPCASTRTRRARFSPRSPALLVRRDFAFAGAHLGRAPWAPRRRWPGWGIPRKRTPSRPPRWRGRGSLRRPRTQCAWVIGQHRRASVRNATASSGQPRRRGRERQSGRLFVRPWSGRGGRRGHAPCCTAPSAPRGTAPRRVGRPGAPPSLHSTLRPHRRSRRPPRPLRDRSPPPCPDRLAIALSGHVRSGTSPSGIVAAACSPSRRTMTSSGGSPGQGGTHARRQLGRMRARRGMCQVHASRL